MKMNPNLLDPMEPRKVSILGSTGSVGCSTVDLVARYPDSFPVQVLVANKNWQLLAQQTKQLQPKLVVIGDATYYKDLKNALSDTRVEITAGEEAVVAAGNSFPMPILRITSSPLDGMICTRPETDQSIILLRARPARR